MTEAVNVVKRVLLIYKFGIFHGDMTEEIQDAFEELLKMIEPIVKTKWDLTILVEYRKEDWEKLESRHDRELEEVKVILSLEEGKKFDVIIDSKNPPTICDEKDAYLGKLNENGYIFLSKKEGNCLLGEMTLVSDKDANYYLLSKDRGKGKKDKGKKSDNPAALVLPPALAAELIRIREEIKSKTTVIKNLSSLIESSTGDLQEDLRIQSNTLKGELTTIIETFFRPEDILGGGRCFSGSVYYVLHGFPSGFHPRSSERDSTELNRWIEENIIQEIKDQNKYPLSDLNVMRWVHDYTYLPDTQKAANRMSRAEQETLDFNRRKILDVFKIDDKKVLAHAEEREIIDDKDEKNRLYYLLRNATEEALADSAVAPERILKISIALCPAIADNISMEQKIRILRIVKQISNFHRYNDIEIRNRAMVPFLQPGEDIDTISATLDLIISDRNMKEKLVTCLKTYSLQISKTRQYKELYEAYLRYISKLNKSSGGSYEWTEPQYGPAEVLAEKFHTNIFLDRRGELPVIFKPLTHQTDNFVYITTSTMGGHFEALVPRGEAPRQQQPQPKGKQQQPRGKPQETAEQLAARLAKEAEERKLTEERQAETRRVQKKAAEEKRRRLAEAKLAKEAEIIKLRTQLQGLENNEANKKQITQIKKQLNLLEGKRDVRVEDGDKSIEYLRKSTKNLLLEDDNDICDKYVEYFNNRIQEDQGPEDQGPEDQDESKKRKKREYDVVDVAKKDARTAIQRRVFDAINKNKTTQKNKRKRDEKALLEAAVQQEQEKTAERQNKRALEIEASTKVKKKKKSYPIANVTLEDLVPSESTFKPPSSTLYDFFDLFNSPSKSSSSSKRPMRRISSAKQTKKKKKRSEGLDQENILATRRAAEKRKFKLGVPVNKGGRTKKSAKTKTKTKTRKLRKIKR